MKIWQHINGYNHVEGDTGQGLSDNVEQDRMGSSGQGVGLIFI